MHETRLKLQHFRLAVNPHLNVAEAVIGEAGLVGFARRVALEDVAVGLELPEMVVVVDLLRIDVAGNGIDLFGV